MIVLLQPQGFTKIHRRENKGNSVYPLRISSSVTSMCDSHVKLIPKLCLNLS